ncbi:ATP-binding protein [Hydrogenophaga sp.]|uniref:ATP-binding response regulator n=1 Tax=Hydrogenophaga sp. TaxID=1904254 RepID=UPI00262E1689|nr:ATP-binding protein [Hydrogenophaga sp.]MCW5655237.1 hypothetical protein [Hydrogenophaga sp.]
MAAARGPNHDGGADARPGGESTVARLGLSDAELQSALEYLDVDQSMAGARGVVIPYTIVLIALFALMQPFSPLLPSLVWAGSFATYILTRHRMNRVYASWSEAERKERLRSWHRTLVVTSMVFGGLWGSAVFIAFPGSPNSIHLLWTVAVTTMVAGAPRLLTMPQFVALVSTMLLFTGAAWLAWGGWLGSFMAVALTVLAGLFVVMARHFHRGLREKFELQLRNQHLARELSKRNTTLEQMAQSKTLLLAAASHDLRQPVHALGLLMEIVRRTQEPQTLRRRLTMATDCVESLSEMLTNLLDFTRMDAGQFPVALRSVPLQEVLDETMRTFGPIARRKGLTLRIVQTSASVRSDAHLLHRMLFNLVSNAIKYTHKGWVRVYVEQRDDQVFLHVQDSGSGIAADRLDEVFKDYVTSDAQSLRFDVGIGLGLGIVRRCAALLGHALEVQSMPGEGSRFSIHLGERLLAGKTQAPEIADAVALHGVVAVIENDPVILEGLSEMLRTWGCQPVAGATPHEVLALLDRLHITPKLILSDLHLSLPESGFDAIGSLRQRMGVDHLPAVMLTGDLNPAHQQRARSEQIRLEHKPLRPARLREVLGAMLEQP